MDELQFFDPADGVTIVSKSLPHWAQAGTLCFITWRTADSLPGAAMDRITGERQRLLSSFGLDGRGDWRRELGTLPPRDRGRLQWSLLTTLDGELDAGAGECVLVRSDLSQIVEDSLLHFDGDRYIITDIVVMPNHVHLLAAFQNEGMLISQCTSWKRYTGRRINDVLGRSGEFWQVEQFDHLVRSQEQFQHYRRYIADNPRKAGLTEGRYRWYSKALR